MSLLKRGLPSLSSSSAVGLLLIFPVFWLFARLQVEWSWFAQFGQQGTYGQRLGFQLLGAGLAFLLVLFTAWWRHRWMQAYIPTPRGEIPASSGGIYFLSLFACLSILLSVLAVTTRLAWLAWKQPFLLAHWWSVPFRPEWSVLFISILLIVLITLGLGRRRRINLAFLYGSLCLCVVAGRSWGLWALAITIPDSGTADPLLGADLSFGLARFSAIALALQLLLLQILLTLSTSAWSRLTRSPCLSDWGFPGWNEQERALLRPALVALLLVLAALTWLVRHQLLWTQSGLIAGAGWIDIHLRLPLREWVALLLVLMAGTCLPWPGKRQRQRRRLRTALFTLALIAVLSELLLSPIVQWMVVRPRELQLETPYLSRSIAATRQAYQLDSIRARGITPTQEISEEDLIKGASTLQNIRLWDSQPMLDTNRQLQQLRVYYQFANASVDRYPLNEGSNENQQVIISARELDQASLPARSRTWQNKHFVFTHGFGFTMNPVDTREPDGLPAYFISDLGQSTQIEGNKSLGISKETVEREVPIGRAALYFGSLYSPYAVAPTKIDEFDYPEGDENTYNHYSGSAGVPLEHLWQRITAATYLADPRFLNTGALTKESRLLLRRDVKERVHALAPFLDLMGEPYLVSVPIDDAPSGYQQGQHQYWIVDAFTSSRTVPYASTLPDGRPLRYLRNSVKAVVDAYNGKVHFYINEPNDPMIQGWTKVFPSLFENLENMPTSLRRHLMVSQAQFELQVQQLLRYHVTNPRIFYSGDDVWQVPKELYGNNQIPVAPYHITAQVKPSPNSEFLLLQPLTPLARPNLSAWLAARNDDEHYGELILLRFPTDIPIFGPEQVQALINQDPAISQQFALWDRAGSQVVQGNLLVVPVGDSLLYVEPIYLRAQQGGLPTLTRIVVSDGRRVAMAADLDQGLKSLLERRQQETLKAT